MNKLAILYDGNRYVGAFRCVCRNVWQDLAAGIYLTKRMAFLCNRPTPYLILDESYTHVLVQTPELPH